MADIFISYASDDREHAARLAAALAQRGWTVWWDRQLRTGIDYVRAIEEQLDGARCVVVLWSAKSKDSRWVRDEADSALRRGVLMPVAIDDVLPPMGMRGLQTARLIDWDGSADAPAFIGIADDIAALLGSGKPAKTVNSAPRRPRVKPLVDAAPAVAAPGKGKMVGVGLAVVAALALAGYLALRPDPAPAVVNTPPAVAAAVPASAGTSAAVALRPLEELMSRVEIEKAQCLRPATGKPTLTVTLDGTASGPRGAWVSLQAFSMGTTAVCDQWHGMQAGTTGCARSATDGKLTAFRFQTQPLFLASGSDTATAAGRAVKVSVALRYKGLDDAEPRTIARAETTMQCPR